MVFDLPRIALLSTPIHSHNMIQMRQFYLMIGFTPYFACVAQVGGKLDLVYNQAMYVHTRKSGGSTEGLNSV